jgi:hypothetical protein
MPLALALRGLSWSLVATAAFAQFPAQSPLPATTGVEDVAVVSESSWVASPELGRSLAPLGDFNGDGHPDFALGAAEWRLTGESESRGACYVLFGGSAWDSGSSLQLQGLPSSRGIVLRGSVPGDRLGSQVAGIGDVNSDGFADLAVLASGPSSAGPATFGTIYILFGGPSVGLTGALSTAQLQGSLGLTIVPPVGDYFSAPLRDIGDVDADGVDDLALSDPRYSPPQPTFQLGVELFSRMAVGDIDGDGDADFVVARPSSNGVVVYMNQGTFFTNYPMLTGSVPASVNLSDLDQDGDLDLIVAQPRLTGSSVSVLRHGLAGFNPPVHVDFPKRDLRVGIADVDGDGDVDVVAGNYDESNSPSVVQQVAVLLNNGNGGLAIAATMPIDDQPRSVACADLDADGDGDIVVSGRYITATRLFENLGGTFAGPVSHPALGVAAEFLIGDLDNDGDLDVLRSCCGTIVLHRNSGGVALQPGVSIATFNYEQTRARLVDVDADGWLDVVTSSLEATENLVVRRNDGAGNIPASGRLYRQAIAVRDFDAFDVDADGDLDQVLLSRAFGGTSTSLVIAEGFGDGGYTGGEAGRVTVVRGAAIQAANAPILLEGAPPSVAFEIRGRHASERLGESVSRLDDLDGDGADDFAIGVSGAWLPGNGPGAQRVVRGAPGLGGSGWVDVHSLTGPDGFVVHSGPPGGTVLSTGVSTGDFDADGFVDLVVGVFGVWPQGGRRAGAIVFGSAGLGSSGVERVEAFDGMQRFALVGLTQNDSLRVGRNQMGDLNGDGFDDLLLGAPFHGANNSGVGAVYGWFGAPRPLAQSVVAVADVTGADGFRFIGPTNDEQLGWAVSFLGDVNGDGIDDFGATAPRFAGGVGQAHVVLGQRYGPPTVYCSAQPNSLGCTPTLQWSGELASASDPDSSFVTATSVANQKNGQFFYGRTGPAAQPFLGATLCVQPPLRRMTQQSSGGTQLPLADCTGSLSVDWNAWIRAGSDPALLSGVTVHSQAWIRDPLSPSGANLTLGLMFTIGP